MRYLFFLFIASFSCGQNKFSIKNGSEIYSVEFTVETCQENTCQGKGFINFYLKNGKKPFQKIESEDLFFYLDSLQKPSVNIVELYGEQSPFIFDDFNFDGSEDVAVRNGNNSSYSGPSYDVYVFHKNKKKFVFSSELTDLVTDNLGMFQVNRKEKKIITFAKSGCCWHQSNEYKVEPKKGLHLVREFTEDATGGEKVIVTDKKKIKGKWVVNTKTYKIEEYYTE